MPGNNRPPYRLPCAGWKYSWPGKKFAHGRFSEQTVPLWEDNTSPPLDVRDPQSYYIAPCSTSEPGDAPIGPYPYPTPQTIELRSPVVYGEFAECEKVGHKNLQARRSWHGHFGFCSEPGESGFVATKYRTAVFDFSIVGSYNQVGNPPVEYEKTKHTDSTVDFRSGIIELNDAEVDIFTEDATDTIASADYTAIPTSLNVACEITARIPLIGNFNNNPSLGFWDTTTGTLAEIEALIAAVVPLQYYNADDTYTLTPQADTLWYVMKEITVVDSDHTATHFKLDLHLAYGQGTADSTGILDDGHCSGQFFDEFDLSWEIALSDANTFQSVLDDCYLLASTTRTGLDASAAAWDLTDDVQYPWRRDEYLTVAPLLTRDEVRGFVPISGWSRQIVSPLFGPDTMANGTSPYGSKWDCYNYASPINNVTADVPFSAGWIATPDWDLISDHDPNSFKWTWDAGAYADAVSNGYAGSAADWIELTDRQRANYSDMVTVSYDRFTGDIMGGPSGYPGAQIFDPEHATYFGCNGGATTDEFVRYVGAQTGNNLCGDDTDLAVPLESTQWTNNLEAAEQFPGAWIRTAGGEVVIQAAPFTGVQRPSYNFARPCGVDRWRPDETLAECVDSDNGTNAIVLPGASPIATGTLCVVHTGADDGVWLLTTADNITYARSGAKVANLPTGMIFEADDDNFIAPVRWQSGGLPSKPAICGRVSVATATQSGGSGTAVTIELAEATQLIVGDLVNFSGVGTLGSSVAVVSVLTPTGFTVALAGALGAYTSGGYASSTGAAAWYWNDDQPKGSYTVHEWYFDYDAGATPDSDCGLPVVDKSCTGGCLPFTNCSPSVVAITPNGETWPNGITYDFPAASALNFDGTDGVLWQAAVNFTMVDLLWQEPHTPQGADCATPPNWTEDDGGCLADNSDASGTAIYYPHSPVVEALCGLPSIASPSETAPALPSGAAFAVYCPSSAVGYVPLAEDSPSVLIVNEVETEHGLWLRERDCSCDEGRFQTEYEANRAICGC